MICRCGRASQTYFAAIGLSREIDEELESHIAEAIEQGRDPAEARRAFGSVLRNREESRDVRLIAWLDSLRADAVFGWRQLLEEEGDVGGGDSVAGAGDRRLHVGLPADRRAAAAAVAGGSTRSGCTPSLSKASARTARCVTYDSCSYPMFRGCARR